MRYRKEVKAAILNMLASRLDGCLFKHGFTRNSKSLEYRRQVPEASQILDMQFESHPSSDPGADAHMYPWTFIGVPAAYELALRMVADPALLGDPGKILCQPIDWAAPKAQRQRWYLRGEQEIMNVGEPIGEYVERWVLPFLDEFSSLRGLVRAFETNDVVGKGKAVEERRTFIQESTAVCVAAAYLRLGDTQGAMRVLEKKLGRPDLRERYSKAFEYVEREIASDI